MAGLLFFKFHWQRRPDQRAGILVQAQAGATELWLL
jgi:hypothetical protein